MAEVAEAESAIKEKVRIPENSQTTNRVFVFIIVAMSLLMTTVDGTIVATALRTIQEELHTTINWAGWTLTAYSFGFVLMLPVSGMLSEQFGTHRVFIASITIFSIASLCCGLTSNIFVLIALRVVQAIGGAGITPSATGIIVNHFGESRDRAVSLFGSIFPIGAMIGPIFGGLFVTYWTWRGIFFVNLPIGLAVVLLAIKYIPHDPPLKKHSFTKMDGQGILFLGSGILALMSAASYFGEKGSRVLSLPFITLSVLTIGCLALFFRHVGKTKNPLIKPLLIYGRNFGAVNLINIIYGGISMGVIALVPLYAANRYHISALNSGTLLVAEGIAAVVLSAIFTMLLRRTGYRLPLYIGCAVMIVGMVLLALPPLPFFTPFWWLATATFLIGSGAGIINPPGRNAGLQLAPQHSSTIAALRSMCLQLGGIFTIAIATAVIAESDNSGIVQSFIYYGVAAVFLLSLPLIAKIPEHHGSW